MLEDEMARAFGRGNRHTMVFGQGGYGSRHTMVFGQGGYNVGRRDGEGVRSGQHNVRGERSLAGGHNVGRALEG